MGKTKGIIFDLDGTLTLTQNLHYQAYAEVFKKYGITYTPEEDIEKYAGSGSHNIFKSVFAKRDVKNVDIEECILEKRRIYGELLDKAEIPLVFGVEEFLKRLEVKGIPVVVATGNQKESARIILEKAGLLKYFSSIFSIQDVKKGKPAPDVFLASAKYLQLAPSECVVLEDAENGVEAAKSAGMRCIALSTMENPDKLKIAGASAVVKDYFEITDALLGV